LRETTIVPAEDEELEVVTYEAAGLDVTKEVQAFRKSWLGSKVR